MLACHFFHRGGVVLQAVKQVFALGVLLLVLRYRLLLIVRLTAQSALFEEIKRIDEKNHHQKNHRRINVAVVELTEYFFECHGALGLFSDCKGNIFPIFAA